VRSVLAIRIDIRAATPWQNAPWSQTGHRGSWRAHRAVGAAIGHTEDAGAVVVQALVLTPLAVEVFGASSRGRIWIRGSSIRTGHMFNGATTRF